MEPDNYDYDSTPSSNPIQPTTHTEFLDLTNGEGEGEEGNDAEAMMYDDVDAQYRDFAATPPPIASAPQAAGADCDGTAQGNSTMSTTFTGGKLTFDPSTPGRVVETGQEHTGRWTKEEHESFLSALKMYGKEWKKVAAKVKTRTVVQTRTHAQKYFQKLAKASGGTEDAAQIEMRVASEAKKHSETYSSQKKKQRVTPLKVSRTASVASAAKVISSLHNAQQPLGGTSLLHGFLDDTMTTGSNVLSPEQQPTAFSSSSHGFSSAFAEPTQPAFASSLFAAPKSTIGTSAFPMKIIAPDHDAAIKRGKFPEPSPAACGKRKLAEIAAARMLAGVAASETLLPPPSSGTKFGSDRADWTDSIYDGIATPPPKEEATALQRLRIPPPAGSLDTKPPPPLAAAPPPKRPMGLSLQIVNPESLGVSHEQIEKRRKDGHTSPVTPWEGQLQALVSEEKRKGPSLDATSSLSLPKAPVIESLGMPTTLHPICGPASGFGRSLLHKAVCDMDIAGVHSQLSSGSGDYLERRDQKGYCPIHSACALCLIDPINSAMAGEIVRLLLSAGADASIRDLDGNSSLHWAARAGDKGTAELLLLKNSPKDARNERGETPLHWAMRAGRVGISVVTALTENGARPAVWSKDFKRPIDVAAEGFIDDPESVIDIRALVEKRKKITKEQRQRLREAGEERKEARENLFRCSPQSRTLVLYHPECLEHIPKSESDWECPGRITSIMARLEGCSQRAGNPLIYPWEVQLSKEFERAKLDLLRRVHSTEYLNFVNELSKDLELQRKAQNRGRGDGEAESGGSHTPPVVPFTPMVQRSMIKVNESNVKLGQHSDTSFSAGSLRAARRAAGAVQHAVDCVLVGRQRNAFCLVRPPGHHAGINGLLDGGESCGFCIFNSIAAGAMHAISDERLLCERCAIVDLDVHHGNGTEEIVRNCHDPSKLFFFSIHLYDNDRKGKRETKSFQYKFYPGTGDEDDLPLNIINVPIIPMWKDKSQNSAGGGTHNTRHRTRNRAVQSDDGDSSEAGTPRVSDAEVESRISSGASSPVPPGSTNGGGMSGRHAYRKSIQNRLLPALRAFNPDLILISAGFDACKGDVGNAKHEIGGNEKMGIDLEPEDYAWTTRKVLEIADICCQGRVVSVLEGGYGRHPATGTFDPTQPLDKSLFSECAIRHIHAMIDPYNVEGRFGSSRN